MSRKPVMIVEDEPDIRENMVMLLEDEGYEVYSASNGEEALRILHDSSKPLPGLVALDFYMPVLDARGFLAELPSLQRVRDISQVTILLVTASDPASRKDLEAKTITALRKPIDIEEFLGWVKRCCDPPSNASP